MSGNIVSVVALRGFYTPQVGDHVIGVVEDIEGNGWKVDINAPYPAFLPASEVFGRRFDPLRHKLFEKLPLGSVVYAKVRTSDRTQNILLTLRGSSMGKIEEGILAYITPQKIPRLIGKSGSMIALMKQFTNTKLIVGENGRIVVMSRDKTSEERVLAAIKKIDEEAHMSGLTERVIKVLRGEA
ncbi:MAG: exosome complex RNA-binding protein Rrp4, partial [Candidatus Bathyarchaeia archaeon]